MERFSFLSKIPYDEFLIKNSILSTPLQSKSPVQSVIDSVLYSGNMNMDATIRGAQEISNAVSTSSGQTVDAINSSTELLSNQINNIALANLFGSVMVVGAVAVASRYIGGKLDNISVGIDRLGSQFSEGFSLLATKLDINNNVLNGVKEQLEIISETLKSPTLTKAAEWRDLGLKRLGNGLYPEAIEAFNKSVELESTDPIVNLMLGKLYLDAVDNSFNYHDPDLAAEYFYKAIRYASATLSEVPALKDVYIEALYLRSVSLMLKASRLFLSNNSIQDSGLLLKDALATINQLLSINPNHRQGIYHKAKLLLLLGDKGESKSLLTELISIDSSFLFAIYRDSDFIHHSDIGDSLINEYNSAYVASLLSLGNIFYDLFDKAISYQHQLPCQVYEWLIREDIDSKSKGMKYFQGLTLMDCIRKGQDYVSLFVQANNELEKIVKSYEANNERVRSDFLLQYNSLKKKIIMGYMHNSLFPKRILNSIEDIESYPERFIKDKSVLDAETQGWVLMDLAELVETSKEVDEGVQSLGYSLKLSNSQFYKQVIKKNYQSENMGYGCMFTIATIIISIIIGSVTDPMVGIISYLVLGFGGSILFAQLFTFKHFRKKYYESRFGCKLNSYPPAYKEYITGKIL